MGRPRKDPSDPKWQQPAMTLHEIRQNVGSSEEVPTKCKACGGKAATPDPWQIYFAAAMTGLIARGGASMDSLIRTARQYADEAVRATNES